jgi:hypothetical protein
MPRWFKILLVAVGVLAVLLVLVALFSGGRHGPSRHLGHPPTGMTPMAIAAAAT